MKHFILLLLAAVAVVRYSVADEWTDSKKITWKYTVSNGEATVTDCPSMPWGEVTIPEKMNGIPVVKIAGNTFKQYFTHMTSIVIPDSVREIDVSAFEGCTALSNVVIGAGVKTIASTSFLGCENIRAVTFKAIPQIRHASVATGDWILESENQTYREAVYRCPVVKSYGKARLQYQVVVNSNYGYARLQWRVLDSMSKYSKLSVCVDGKNPLEKPSSGTGTDGKQWQIIDMHSLSRGTHIISWEYSMEGKETGGGDAWVVTGLVEDKFLETTAKSIFPDSYSRLTSISLASGFKIPNGFFEGCSGIESVEASSLQEWIENKFEGEDSNPLSFGGKLYIGGELLRNLVLPEGVTQVGAYAFCGCSTITNVVFPRTVTSVYTTAFSGCNNIKSTTIRADGMMLYWVFPSAQLESVKILNERDFIGENFAEGCLSLKRIDIPDGIRTIGAYAFYRCSSLTNVVIPSSVRSVGDEAFGGCGSLLEISLPDGVNYIGLAAFKDCLSLRRVRFPRGVTRVGDGAFSNCVNLDKIEVSSLEDWLSVEFHGVTANPLNEGGGLYVDGGVVEDLEVPSEIATIGRYVFAGCGSITNVTIPVGIESIWDTAFSACKNITTVTLRSKPVLSGVEKVVGSWQVESSTWDGHVLYRAPEMTRGHSAEMNISVVGPRSFTFRWGALSPSENCDTMSWSLDGVVQGWIDVVNAYSIDGNLKTVTLTVPAGQHDISWTYSRETGSTYWYEGAWVELPASMSELTFSGLFPDSYQKISKVKYQCFAESISDDEFSGCSNLEEVVMPAGVQQIGERAFCGCSGLAEMTIPDGVKSVGRSAFCDCDGLTSVTIPSSVVNIGQAAFDGCSGLTTVHVSLGDARRISELYPFDASVRIVAPSMPDFEIDCGVLTKYTGTGGDVVIPSFVTAIGHEAFRNCEALTSIMLPSGVTDIGDAAFYDCYGLTNVVIQEGVTNIGQCAFWGCKKLTSIRIPDSVRTIGWVAFWGCQSLRLISVDSKNQYFCSEEGVLYDKAKKELICCPGGVVTNEIEVAVSVEKISYYGCAHLEKIVLPPKLKNIEGATFKGCYRLDDIEIPNGVTNIEWDAFCECTSLKTVIIPEGVAGIGENAFSECLNLRSVTIPASVTSIGHSAFSYCSNLDVVYVDNGDSDRVKGLLLWPSNVKFIEVGSPFVEGDEGATVTGDAETGFVIKPSEGNTAVEVTIPQGVDAAKVTVEVSTRVASVKPNGAKVKIVSGGADISEFLNVPAADGNGVVDLTKATVKEEIVKEAMDVEKGAEIKLDAANPSLTTPNTRLGLFYTFSEGRTLGGMERSASKTGDGKPWSPEITVKGGNAAFYSIGVGKGE